MWRDPRAFCFRKQCKKPVRTEVIVSRLFEIRTAHDETLPAPAQDFPGIAPGCRASRTDRRRRHLGSVAKLYREKAGETGAGTEVQSGDTLATSRRERVAAMFRALGDPAGIAKSHCGSDLSE